MPAPAPRRQGSPALSAPTVWTTLRLTLHTDGRTEAELVGGTPFPRHWVSGHDGELVQKTATISFEDGTSGVQGAVGSPGGRGLAGVRDQGRDRLDARDVPDAHARRPAVGSQLRSRRVVTHQGEPVEGLFVVLDGMLSVEVDGP